MIDNVDHGMSNQLVKFPDFVSAAALFAGKEKQYHHIGLTLGTHWNRYALLCKYII